MTENCSTTVTVHVEVARNPNSQLKCSELAELLRHKYKDISVTMLTKGNLAQSIQEDLNQYIEFLRLYVEPEDFRSRNVELSEGHNHSGLTNETSSSLRECVSLLVYVFDLCETGEEEEFMEDDEDGANSPPASHSWILPSKEFDDNWDSLYFASDIKTRLMEFVESALLFSEKGVNSTLVAWNKVILLHGPAGSGKTSLCKALAQKATIRLSGRYSYGQLIEINSHSLFSKWFSESGKLVMKMFEQIHEVIQDPKALIFLLIDEVESLAKCRKASEAGNEPGDSLRAVNALLTQIDRIRKYPNVMILTTSNLVSSIDDAFVSRADMKIYIGSPPPVVVYKILASSINELIRVGIIDSKIPIPLDRSQPSLDPNIETLFQIAIKCERMSGRTLRKIPFLTHANFLRRQNKCPLPEFLRGMNLAVDREWAEHEALKNGTKLKSLS